MRMTQFAGLSPAAKDFLAENAEEDSFVTTKNGEVIKEWTESRSEASGKHAQGMYMEEISLSKYWLKAGVFVLEKVQAASWSSGPVIFTYLTNAQGEPIKGTSWTEEEMEEYL